jgi:hypothetical protein
VGEPEKDRGVVVSEVSMKRSSVSKTKPEAGGIVMVYMAGVKGKVPLKVAVASPAAIRRALKLSPTSKRRVERVLRQSGFGRKAG